MTRKLTFKMLLECLCQETFIRFFKMTCHHEILNTLFCFFSSTIYIENIISFFLSAILLFNVSSLCPYGKRRSRQSRKDSIVRHIFFREGVGVPPNNPVRVKQKHEKNEEEHSIIGGDICFQIYLINHPN